MIQPTMEEVAGWLREAAKLEFHAWCQSLTHSECQRKANRWYIRASWVEAMGWRPIDSAPKDGSEALYYHNGCVNSAKYENGRLGGQGWSYAEWSYPTHWMPMPQPPVTK